MKGKHTEAVFITAIEAVLIGQTVGKVGGKAYSR